MYCARTSDLCREMQVLVRGVNTPMMLAAWLAVLKAGGIAVATMPLLRGGELAKILEKAQIDHALCDYRAMRTS